MLTATQAAARLGISRARLHQLVRAGHLPGVQRFGKMLQIPSEAIEALIEERRRIIAGEERPRGGSLPNLPNEALDEV